MINLKYYFHNLQIHIIHIMNSYELLLLEGLSTGSMFLTAYLMNYNQYNLLYFLFCHWIASYLCHLYHLDNPIYFLYDIIGIHITSLVRLYINLQFISKKFQLFIIMINYCIAFYKPLLSINHFHDNNLIFVSLSVLWASIIFIIHLYSCNNYPYHIFPYVYLFFCILSYFLYQLSYYYQGILKTSITILFHLILGVIIYYERLMNHYLSENVKKYYKLL